MKKLSFLTFLAIGAAAINLRGATYQFFTDEADFLNAVVGKPAYTNNYAALSPWGTRLNTNNFNFTNGSTFGYTANIPLTGPAFDNSFWGDTYGSVRALSTGAPTNDVFVMTNFSPNTFAFGGYFFPTDGVNLISGGTVSLTALFSDLSSTNVISSRSSANINDWFFGWVTDEPGTAFQSVTFTAGGDYASSANVTLAVPEPSTYALLGLAVAGLAGYVIRRRRA